MENEIAKLLRAYKSLWDDLGSMRNDIRRIVCDRYGWNYFEYCEHGLNVVSESYFFKNKILYVVVDASVDIPYLQVALFSANEKEDIDEVWMKEEEWKGWDPRKLPEDENKEFKKLSEYFETMDLNWGDCVYSGKIDIMSIDSTDRINLDIKELLDAMIGGNCKEYVPSNVHPTGLKFIE